MLKRSLAAGALAAALAAPAAHAQSASTPGHPSQRPPVRLWYRLMVTADLTKQGDFSGPVYTDHRSVHIRLQLRSRTAVLLYRQCEALNIAGFEPRVVAQIIDLERSAVTCAQVRAEARRLGFSNRWIGAPVRRGRAFPRERGRLRRLLRAPHRRPGARDDQPETGPEPIDCPAQTYAIVRLAGPETVGGSLATASAARDGVNTSVAFPLTLRGTAYVGSEGGPCHVRSTGAEVLVPHLIDWFRGDAFGQSPGYGETPTPSLLRFNIGRRFGRSFAIEGRESVEEPMANGTWVTSGPVKLEFDLCARGGRRAGDC